MAAASLCAALLLLTHVAVQAASEPVAARATAGAAVESTAPAPISPAAASAAPPAPDLRFIYQTVVLPQGKQGSDYGPRAIMKGGLAPYTFAIEGKFPPGLEVTPQGMLGGLPTTAGSYSFVLKARDASNPPLLTQQSYVLRVTAPQGPRASAPKPPMTAITREEAAAVPDPHRGQPMSYKLTPDGIERLAALVAPEEAAAAAPAEIDPAAVATPAEPPKPAPVAPVLLAQPLPSAEQLSALLQPLRDIEYPTQSLFESALQSAHCVYYRTQLKQLAEKKGVKVDTQCPPPQPAAAAASRYRAGAGAGATSALPLHQFYAELMPSELRALVVAEAAQVHPLDEAKRAEWDGPGCGCAPRREGEKLVYGFYPFWHATDKSHPVNFSLLHRVSYMGLVLNDAGAYDSPAHWAADRGPFVREARRHNTAVDLVLYRRDWTTLLQLPQAKLNEVARLAASNAVAAADAPIDERRSPFLPALRSPRTGPVQAYDGLTVFFEDSPADPEGKKRFRLFFKAFMTHLIEEMQRSARPYFLNIAVPDQEVREEGAYPFRDLLDYFERATPPPSTETVAATSMATAVRYKGTTDITVKYLVLLGSPSDDRKKELRAAIDQADGQGLQGHRRIAILESVVPVLFYRRAEAQEPLPPVDADQLDKDFAYIKWTYGDVAVWPVPEAGTGAGEDVNQRLATNFGEPAQLVDGLCRWICPNRSPLHLLLKALMLANAFLVTAYLWNCRIRGQGRTYLALMWGSGLLALLIAFGLLNCDPGLAVWRETNDLLYGLILVVCVGGLYASFRRRVEAP